jgi:hypothetical protein
MTEESSQAARAFAALRVSRRRGAARRRRARPARAISPLTLDRALAAIGEAPQVRPGAVARGRRRVARGEHPPADEVAEAVVRRAGCDRVARSFPS